MKNAIICLVFCVFVSDFHSFMEKQIDIAEQEMMQSSPTEYIDFNL